VSRGDDRHGRAERNRLFRWRDAIVNSTLTPTQRFVALVLSLHMDREGDSCWPSLSTLAAETGLSRRTVIRALNDLDPDFLMRKRGGPGRGPTRYTAVLPSDTPVTTRRAKVVTQATPGSDTHGTRGRPLGRQTAASLNGDTPPEFDPDRLLAEIAALEGAR
jgi:hypothetical protein